MALTNVALSRKLLERLCQLPNLKTCLVVWPKMDGNLDGARASNWDGSGLVLVLHARPKSLGADETVLPKAKMKLGPGRMTLEEFTKRWFCRYVERGEIWDVVEELPTPLLEALVIDEF